MKYIRVTTGFYLLIIALLVLIEGCHHPQALYEEPPRSPLEKGRTFEKKRKYAEAEQQYQQIDSMIVRDMALNHLSAAWDNVNANIIRSQGAVSQQPHSAEARLQLAQDYYTKGLLCTRYTKGLVGQYPKDFIFGEEEFYYSEALLQAKRALRLQPSFPEAQLLIGEIYLANLRKDEALKELKRLVKKNPDFAKGYYAIAKVYFDMEDYDTAEKYLIRSYKLDPNLYDVYYLLGKIYLEKDWFDYAAFTFLETLRKNPDDRPTFDLLVEACHKLGNYYLQKEQYAQAIRLFREILRVESSYDVHQDLLLARTKQKEAEEEAKKETAAKEAEEATSPQTVFDEFKALLFADQSFDKVIFGEEFDDPKLNDAVERFREDKFEEGYAILQTEPQKNKTDPYRALALAFAHQKLGRLDKAKQTLREMARKADVQSRARLWAWKALRDMGEQLDTDTIYQVLGVIIEVQLPDKEGIDTLAAYADGRIRYISFSGKMIIWERVEGELPDLARKVVNTAQKISRDFPLKESRPALETGNIRVSLLTCGGVRVVEDTELRVRQHSSVLSPVFIVGTNLLESLLAFYSKE